MKDEILTQEAQTVSIEAIEETEEGAVSLSTETLIDEKLVHLLAVIAARRDTKARKWVPFYWAIAAFMIGSAAYWSYTYFITKTGTRGPVIIALMVIMAVILIRYLVTPAVQVAEQRMLPFLGQRWAYRFDDKGIHMQIQGKEGCFAWEEVAGWWEEDGYLIYEINGQVLAVRKDTFSSEALEALNVLSWVYLGDKKSEAV